MKECKCEYNGILFTSLMVLSLFLWVPCGDLKKNVSNITSQLDNQTKQIEFLISENTELLEKIHNAEYKISVLQNNQCVILKYITNGLMYPPDFSSICEG